MWPSCTPPRDALRKLLQGQCNEGRIHQPGRGQGDAHRLAAWLTGVRGREDRASQGLILRQELLGSDGSPDSKFSREIQFQECFKTAGNREYLSCELEMVRRLVCNCEGLQEKNCLKFKPKWICDTSNPLWSNNNNTKNNVEGLCMCLSCSEYSTHTFPYLLLSTAL